MIRVKVNIQDVIKKLGLPGGYRGFIELDAEPVEEEKVTEVKAEYAPVSTPKQEKECNCEEYESRNGKWIWVCPVHGEKNQFVRKKIEKINIYSDLPNVVEKLNEVTRFINLHLNTNRD